MMDTAEIINEAIAVMAGQPSVFSAQDVADYADLDSSSDAITDALRVCCSSGAVLSLDELKGEGVRSSHYLGRDQAERWWVDSTLRWARAGVRQLPTAKLAGELSMAFDVQQWTVVPRRLVSAGRRFALVADGGKPDTFVFPWVAVICANPGSAKWLRPCIGYLRGQTASGELQRRFSDVSLDEAVGQILTTVTEREADIIRSRIGIENGQRATLEQLGRKHGVTRERIRQVEARAWRKLHRPARLQSMWLAFATDFVQSGGRLVIPEDEMTPCRQFIHRGIDLQTVHIPELGLRFISDDADFTQYREALAAIDPQQNASRNLEFLSRQDEAQVIEAESHHMTARVQTRRAYMLREALRSLGRAAHYEDIAIECNRMFPERANTAHNWHAALSYCAQPDSEELGIVWIGARGTYGLKEHGYSRPDADLFTQVAEIVEQIYSRTGRPSSEAEVVSELGTLRRELNINSVKLALSLNDRVEATVGGFVPKASDPRESPKPETPQYDIDAAFTAFMGHTTSNTDEV